MPWIDVSLVKDSISASNYKSEAPSVLICDDTAMSIIDTTKITRNNQNMILVLLSSNNFIHHSPPSITLERFPYTAKADLVFVEMVNCNTCMMVNRNTSVMVSRNTSVVVSGNA
jgi:hypothetical protein